VSGKPYIRLVLKRWGAIQMSKTKQVRALLPAIVVVLLVAFVAAEQPPDWAIGVYPGPVDRVFAAALLSIQEQHHEVKSRDDAAHTVDFHVGVTSWSWGYNMRLTATPVSDGKVQVVVGVTRSGTKAVSWGSGKKEVRKILAGIDAELAAQKAGLK
jgi:hypothetical protein